MILGYIHEACGPIPSTLQKNCGALKTRAGVAGDLPRRTADHIRLSLSVGVLALFDLEAPEICLKQGDEWVFGPEKPYELQGDVDNVAFPCGYTILPDGDTLHLYYGAADTSIAMATGSIGALLEWLEQHQG